MRHEDILKQARIGGYAVVDGEKLSITAIDYGAGYGVGVSYGVGVIRASVWMHDDDITAILPPDDTDVERITDIEKVRVGDTEVTKYGNRYEVVEVDHHEDTQNARLYVKMSDGCGGWMRDRAFAYAERPKLHLPEIPKGIRGPLYFRDAEGNEVIYWRNEDDDVVPWMSSNPETVYADCWSDDGDMPDYITLPLTPCHLEADE